MDASRAPEIVLRPVRDSDLPVFFAHQNDPVAIHMAAFTAADPADHAAFLAHWQRLLADESVVARAVVVRNRYGNGDDGAGNDGARDDGARDDGAREDGEEAVAGHIVRYTYEGHGEVTYWIGREFWGQGIATEALGRFVAEVDEHPLHARVAADNPGSLRVLQKCGFTIEGEAIGFAEARGEMIREFLLVHD